MRKVLRLARREYTAAVRTKGFIIGLLLMPVMMGGSVIAMVLLKDRVETKDLNVAVIDRSGVVADTLIAVSGRRNAIEIFDRESGKKVRPAYIFTEMEARPGDPLQQHAELSDRIRAGELHAFLDIGAGVLHRGGPHEERQIAYHAKNAALDNVRFWLRSQINDQLRQTRLADAGVADSLRAEVLDWIPVQGLGLTSLDEETGEVKAARASHEGEAVGVPLVMMMLMFMMVLMGSTPMLQSIMEEKSQRIAEVLLGSIKPFQFMMGKLLGGLGVSLTSATVYVVGGTILVHHNGWNDFVPFEIIPWFFGFMVLAILMLGSIFAALGSACNDAKEAQSMTLPAMIPIMIPMFIMMPILEHPQSAFATWTSLIPPFTPMLMLLRLSTPAGVPGWQPWVGLGGVILASILAIWAGGRIFRVGILMQGKPPRLADMARWAIRG